MTLPQNYLYHYLYSLYQYIRFIRSGFSHFSVWAVSPFQHGYSKPTVSQQMKRLKEKGLILVDQQGNITLTDLGHSISDMIYERHNELASILEYIGVEETIAKEATKTELYKAIAAASASGDKAASGALIVELEK